MGSVHGMLPVENDILADTKTSRHGQGTTTLVDKKEITVEF